MIQPTRSNKSTGLMRKLHKLKTKPKHFIVDSSGFKLAHRSWKKSLKLGSFLWVVACFAIAALYFCVIVSDRYVSRAELVIKQADQIKMLPDALSMLGIGGSNHEDILIIQDYLKSPDLLEKLDKELSLKAHYQSHKVDYFSRLPENVSREEFIKYYRQHLSLHLDELSGVLTIELQAFAPAYGQRVVALMLQESDRFINKLGHQVALEQLAFVEKEVDRAYQRVQTEKAKVLDFQNNHHLISPESTSSARLGVVSQIEAQLAQQQAQLKQLQSYMKVTAPAVISVQARVDALTQQLAQEQSRLTGADKDAMNEVTARY
ncbi:TPA: sugar transporter, partial [Citrobacter braakii]|nr:sugar transporter [Citrobacter braakii]